MLLPASLLCLSPNAAAREVLLGCQAHTLPWLLSCSKSKPAPCHGLLHWSHLLLFSPLLISPQPPAPSPQLLLKHAGQAPPSHLLHLLLPSASNVLVPGVLMAGLFPPSDHCPRVSSPEPPSLPTLSAIATFHPSTPNLSFLLYFPHSTQHRLTSC